MVISRVLLRCQLGDQGFAKEEKATSTVREVGKVAAVAVAVPSCYRSLEPAGSAGLLSSARSCRIPSICL